MKNKKTLEKMNELVGNNKIIIGIKKSFQFNDEPKFFQYTSFMNDSMSDTDAPWDEESLGSALDIDDDTSKIKALGECIERYCLAKFRKKDFNKSDFSSIKDKATNPINFINYIEINKKNSLKESSIEKKQLFWTDCHDIINNKKMKIPAQLIYVPYKENELLLRAPISNGAACASSKDEAIYKGICELIERDSFMIYYLNKIVPEKINLDSIDHPKIKKIIEKFDRYFLEVNLFNITTDLGVPTILCILVDNSGVGPAISLGTKTDWDVMKCIEGALLEAQHTRLWIRDAMISGKSIDSIDKIKSIQDRGLFWAKKSKIKNLSFFLKSKKNISVSKMILNIRPQDKLKKVINVIKQKKYSLYIKDLSDKKIKDKGFFVFKSIIPELHPLFLFENVKYIFGNRLKNVPRLLGHKIKKLNSEPHPFV